jgi:hypothetical protein
VACACTYTCAWTWTWTLRVELEVVFTERCNVAEAGVDVRWSAVDGSVMDLVYLLLSVSHIIPEV